MWHDRHHVRQKVGCFLSAHKIDRKSKHSKSGFTSVAQTPRYLLRGENVIPIRSKWTEIPITSILLVGFLSWIFSMGNYLCKDVKIKIDLFTCYCFTEFNRILWHPNSCWDTYVIKSVVFYRSITRSKYSILWRPGFLWYQLLSRVLPQKTIFDDDGQRSR